MNFRNTLQHSLDVNYSCGEENYLRLCCVILYCLMFLSSVAYHMENKPIIIIIIRALTPMDSSGLFSQAG